MLEVHHLTKRYSGVTALNDVSFEIRAGEILGYLGRMDRVRVQPLRSSPGFSMPHPGR
jgi:ABC-type Na+ transport system ATPase subunit NatA